MDAIKKRLFIQDLPLNCVPRGQTGTPGEMDFLFHCQRWTNRFQSPKFLILPILPIEKTAFFRQ